MKIVYYECDIWGIHILVARNLAALWEKKVVFEIFERFVWVFSCQVFTVAIKETVVQIFVNDELL